MSITDALNNLLKVAREYATIAPKYMATPEMVREYKEATDKLRWAALDYNKACQDAGLD